MHQFLFRIELIISLFLLIWTLANFAELHSLQECHKIACMRTWVNFFLLSEAMQRVEEFREVLCSSDKKIFAYLTLHCNF